MGVGDKVPLEVPLEGAHAVPPDVLLWCIVIAVIALVLMTAAWMDWFD